MTGPVVKMNRIIHDQVDGILTFCMSLKAHCQIYSSNGWWVGAEFHVKLHSDILLHLLLDLHR